MVCGGGGRRAEARHSLRKALTFFNEPDGLQQIARVVVAAGIVRFL